MESVITGLLNLPELMISQVFELADLFGLGQDLSGAVQQEFLELSL